MHETDISLLSREDIGHGEVIERVVNLGGVPYTTILKHGWEVASCPTSEEAEMINWWQREGWKMWRDGKKKKKIEVEDDR